VTTTKKQKKEKKIENREDGVEFHRMKS